MEHSHSADDTSKELPGPHQTLNWNHFDTNSWEDGFEDHTYRKRQSVLEYLSSLPNFAPACRKPEYLELRERPIFSQDKRRRWPRETRRCRRISCMSAAAKTLLIAPILLLIFFGVLHVLQALVGRARFFWNDTSQELAFLGSHALVRPSVSTAGIENDRQALVPIPCHSHNDYRRDRPLLDAIRWGCIGVEADVWLFDGELYVGHRSSSLTEDRTLRNMYINPLVRMLDESAAASNVSLDELSVFETAPQQTLTLLIDFKNAPEDTYLTVQQQLQPLRDRGYLSFSNGRSVIRRAITVVGTGRFPFETLLGHTEYRDIFFDAPLNALWEPPREPIPKSDSLHSKDGDIDYGTAMSLTAVDSPFSATAMDATLYNTTTSYYASTSFADAVGFVWRGHLSPRQMTIIRGQIRGAKLRGLKARYWATPTWPASLRNHVWHVLVKEGADLLSVDDLEAAALQDWTVPVHDNGFWG